MDIFLNILFLAIGFVLLIKGADFFIDGACSIAERFGIPQIVIGLTIVAMGTSLPETAVSITAAIDGSEALAIGNVIGSNITNVALILGICALMQPLVVQKNTLWVEIPFVVIITCTLLLCGLSGEISRGEGGALIVLFAVFFAYLIGTTISDGKRARKLALAHPNLQGLSSPVEEEAPKAMWLVILMILGGGVAILFGSEFVVKTASFLAGKMGMSQAIIGLTVVALGTSLPELVTSLIAAKKKKTDLAIGNIVGSNIFNILFVLGVTSLIKPITFDPKFLLDGFIAIAVMILLFGAIAVTKKKELGRVAGGLLLSTYVGYNVWLIVAEVAKITVF